MLYAILNKENRLVYFSETARTSEEQEYTELLWTSDIRDYLEAQKCLRPWINLRDDKYYKNVPEIERFMSGDNIDYKYSTVWRNEVEEEINRFNEDYIFLKSIGCCTNSLYNTLDDSLKDKIKYDCDILNYLEDCVGRTNLEIVYFYRTLDKSSREFLKKFSNIHGRDKKSEYLKSNLWLVSKDVVEFLPLWYRLDYKMSDVYGKRISEVSLEYSTKKHLGDTNNYDIEDKVKDMFFGQFELGTVYTGQEIKNIMQFIYNSLGLKRTAKITDLGNYFEMTKVNIGNESSYRIDLRK